MTIIQNTYYDTHDKYQFSQVSLTDISMHFISESVVEKLVPKAYKKLAQTIEKYQIDTGAPYFANAVDISDFEGFSDAFFADYLRTLHHTISNAPFFTDPTRVFGLSMSEDDDALEAVDIIEQLKKDLRRLPSAAELDRILDKAWDNFTESVDKLGIDITLTHVAPVDALVFNVEPGTYFSLAPYNLLKKRESISDAIYNALIPYRRSMGEYFILENETDKRVNCLESDLYTLDKHFLSSIDAGLFDTVNQFGEHYLFEATSNVLRQLENAFEPFAKLFEEMYGIPLRYITPSHATQKIHSCIFSGREYEEFEGAEGHKFTLSNLEFVVSPNDIYEYSDRIQKLIGIENIHYHPRKNPAYLEFLPESTQDK